MFPTKPQCHNCPNKCSKCALYHPPSIPFFIPMNSNEFIPINSNEWHNDMNPAFIRAVMVPNLKIKETILV